jgi:precorrin-6B methylase 2
MSRIVDEHRAYLSDPVRLDAFERAIATVVSPDDIVVDVGCGTGLLGLFACRAGARRVYAIETNGMIEIARAIARANCLADRFVFINRHSSEVVLPEQADVLTGDLIGNMGFEAGLLDVYRDAARFMKPTGRMVPSRITLAAAPVSAPEQFDDVRFWDARRAGFDVSPALRWALNTGYPRRLERDAVLSNDVVEAEFDPGANNPQLRLKGEIAITRGGTLHGLGAWFDAELAPGVHMTNSPLAERRIARRNIFFPLDRTAEVSPGDAVTIDLRVRPYETVVSWDVTLRTAHGTARERHSTLKGMLLSREEMRAHAPDRRPSLTSRGAARRTVLELCDGGHTLREIEREVFEGHTALFRDEGEAQAFVAEVVAGYAKQDG